MDVPSGKQRSSKMSMEMLASRVEGLESRLTFLEKRDKEKNKDIMELKDENLSLHQEILTLKQTRADGQGKEARWKKRILETTGQLKRELERVETLQKVFNRMIVNGHNTELRDELQDVQKTLESLQGEMKDLQSMEMDTKIGDLEDNLENLEQEVSRFRRPGLEDKIISLVRDKLTEGMDVQITVKFERKKLPVDVEGRQTISQLKCVLERKTGVAPHQQVLLFGKAALMDDALTLRDCGIEDGSVLSLSRKDTFTVDVKTPKGSVTLDVDLDLRICDLRSKVNKEIRGIHPSPGQIMKWGQTHLTDEHKTLQDYGIGNLSVITLVEPKNTLTIDVKTPKGWVTLDIEPSLRICDLRLKVNKAIGLVRDSPVQIMTWGQIKLSDEDKTLADYGIGDKSVIQLVEGYSYTHINVNTPKGSVTLYVDLDLRICDFRSKVNEEIGVFHPSPGQIMKWGQTHLTDEHKTLLDYGIRNLSEITLVEPKRSNWRIVVKHMDGTQEVTLDVNVKTTVEEVIPTIHQQMQIPLCDHEALLYNNTGLDRSKLLVECGVRHYAVLLLVTKAVEDPDETALPGMTVFIRTDQSADSWRGDRLVPIEVYPSTTVHRMKCLVHLKTGVRPSRQTLTLNGVALQDTQCVSNCGITDLLTIDVKFEKEEDNPRRQIQVQVFEQGGGNAVAKVTMDACNTVGDLKCVIEDILRQDLNSRRLVLNGVEVSRRNGSFYIKDRTEAVNPALPAPNDVSLSSLQTHSRVTALLKGTEVPTLQLLLI